MVLRCFKMVELIQFCMYSCNCYSSVCDTCSFFFVPRARSSAARVRSVPPASCSCSCSGRVSRIAWRSSSDEDASEMKRESLLGAASVCCDSCRCTDQSYSRRVRVGLAQPPPSQDDGAPRLHAVRSYDVHGARGDRDVGSGSREAYERLDGDGFGAMTSLAQLARVEMDQMADRRLELAQNQTVGGNPQRRGRLEKEKSAEGVRERERENERAREREKERERARS